MGNGQLAIPEAREGGKGRGRSPTHPECCCKLDGDGGGSRRPESMKTCVGVRDEDDDGKLDPHVLLPIPHTGMINSTRRCRFRKRELEASSVPAAIANHSG